MVFRLSLAFTACCLEKHEIFAKILKNFQVNFDGKIKEVYVFSFCCEVYVWIDLYLHKRKHFNDHFAPQAHFCDLSYYYEEYRIVPYHRESLHDLGNEFSESVGLQDAYWGWGPYRNESVLPKKSRSEHRTDSGSRMGKYYNEKIAHFLFSAYQIDYQIFNLEPPKQLPREWFDKPLLTAAMISEIAKAESRKIMSRLEIREGILHNSFENENNF